MQIMRPLSTLLATTVLCASGAAAQTAQDRTFSIAYIPSGQQLQEVATVIRAIADIRQSSADNEEKTIAVHGTPDQIEFAAWILHQVDRPGGQQPPQPGSEPVLEYHMDASGENVVRLFYVPYAKSVPAFQEVVTAIRSATDIRRMFTYNAPRLVAARGTADQMAAAAWLFDQFGKPETSAAAESRMPGTPDDVLQVLHFPHTQTVQDFQEMATVVRSVADIRRLFTYNDARAVVARGDADQLRLAAWLANQLDQTTSSTSPSAIYRLPGDNESVVRIFYLPQTTVAEFQKIVTSIRTTTRTRRAFTYNAIRATVFRGTETQLEQAAGLFAAQTKPKS